MNRLRNVLVTHFNELILKDVISIIVDYSTPHYESKTININSDKNSKCTVVKKLSNDRIAFGFNNGCIYVYDLVNNVTYINTNSNNTILRLHQIDNTVIMYTTTNSGSLFTWDFMNDDLNAIRNPHRYNNIIVLAPYIIAYVVGMYSIKIMDLRTEKITGFNCKDSILKMLTFDNTLNNHQLSATNNILIYSQCKVDYNDMIFNIDIINKTNFMTCVGILRDLNKTTFYKKNYSIDRHKPAIIIPCDDSHSVCIVEINPILINRITVYDIKTKNKNIIISSLNGDIRAGVYLDNNFFALLIDGNIVAYSLINESVVQNIICDTGIFTFLEAVDNGFITVDSNSNIRLHT